MKYRKGFLSFALLTLLFIGFIGTSCESYEFDFDNTPQGNFDALWTILDENYCYFDYKGINWDSVGTSYKARVTPNMSKDALFDLMALMLAELKDGHVNLIATHDISRYWSWKEDYPPNFNSLIIDEYLTTDYSSASSMKYKILDDNVGYIYYGSFSSPVSNSGLSQILNRIAI